MREYINFVCMICKKSGKGYPVQDDNTELRIPEGWTIHYKDLKNGGRLGEEVCDECNPTKAN